MTLGAYAVMELGGMERDLVRASKAALLYADEVVVPDLVFWGSSGGFFSWRIHPETRAALTAAEQVGLLRYSPGTSELEIDYEAEAPDGMISVLIDLEMAARSQGIYDKPTWENVDELYARLLPHDHVPLFSSLSQASVAATASHFNPAPSDRAELALATALLLGQLPAFPDADIDVILDVRERLADARVRFQAVMSEAAKDFADVPPDEFGAEVDRFRRQSVRPALVDIRDKLEELDAIPTLDRLIRNKAIPATAALGLGAVSVSVSGIIAAVFSGGAFATAVAELNARREINRAAQQMPYWYLYEVDPHRR
jgi:hypothetical protein